MRKNALVVIAALAAACAAPQGPPQITPTQPASLQAVVASGRVTFPDGHTAIVKATELTFDAPVPVKDSLFGGKTTLAPVPGDFAQMHRDWVPWPGQGKPATLKPRAALPWNPINLMLGSLYRGVDPQSVRLTSADGSITYKEGTDYLFNADWGQIANNAGAMKAEKLRVTYEWTPKRLDLVQVDRSGAVSVKKGMPVPVCPRLPEPDADHMPLAGVYVATFDSFTVSAGDINMITGAPPVAPMNPDALPRTMAKLKAGEPVRIGIFGASTTEGAEAGPWWDDDSKTYRKRIQTGLHEAYGSDITELGAYQGGKNVKQVMEKFHKEIVPKHPDVVTVHFGLNDAIGPVNGKMKNPPPEFKKDIKAVINAIHGAGAEVILITPYAPHPATPKHDRIFAFCDTLRSLAREEGVTLADVNKEWANLRNRGIPPFAWLHNDNNHPGVDGHKLMADCILRCFGVE